jgi:hypothetical protein
MEFFGEGLEDVLRELREQGLESSVPIQRRSLLVRPLLHHRQKRLHGDLA